MGLDQVNPPSFLKVLCPPVEGLRIYERKPKWFPLIGRSLRDVPALLPVYGWA